MEPNTRWRKEDWQPRFRRGPMRSFGSLSSNHAFSLACTFPACWLHLRRMPCNFKLCLCHLHTFSFLVACRRLLFRSRRFRAYGSAGSAALAGKVGAFMAARLQVAPKILALLCRILLLVMSIILNILLRKSVSSMLLWQRCQICTVLTRYRTGWGASPRLVKPSGV